MDKWIHIIGIAGVSTSGIAVMFKNLGWKVTGSDKGFFPPVSVFLEKHNIQVLPGFKPERLTHNGHHPDLVVYQGLVGENNVELEAAKVLNLTVKSFPQILSEFVLKKDKSIVITGTYGKTTITAALVEIFNKAEKNISYMYGGLNYNLAPTVKALSANTEYSIIEGDEYITSLDDIESKFFKYAPTFLLINSLKWEHTDIFKSEREYCENFIKLIKMIPEQGIIVANANDKNVVKAVNQAKCKVIFYSVNPEHAHSEPEWMLIKDSKPLPTFVRQPLNNSAEIIPYEKNIIGEYNEENLLAAAVMAYELQIRKERIQEAIAGFKGIKRRLEKRFENENVVVIDDFGSSPPKAEGALKAIASDYPDRQIITIFEPNTGNRTLKSLSLYSEAFVNTNYLILPRFTKLPKTKVHRFETDFLAKELHKYYNNVEAIVNDDLLVERVRELITKDPRRKSVVAFLGSHGFRGMIENLIDILKS